MLKLICCFLVGWLITVSLLIFPLGNPSLSESVQGEQFYQSGQIQSAIEVWESSLENSRKSGDAIAQSRILSNLSLAYQQLGQWQKAEALSQESLEKLKELPSSAAQSRGIAQTLNNQGLLQLAQGRANLALGTWREAEKYYAQVADESGRLLSQINQAKALQTLGLNQKACQLLVTGLNLLPFTCENPKIETQDSLKRQQEILLPKLTTLSQPLDIEAWQTLADVLVNSGQLNLSQWLLEKLLPLTGNDQNRARILLNLGKIAQIKGDIPTALDWYQQGEKITSDRKLQIQSQLAQLRLYIDRQEWQKAVLLVVPLGEKFKNIPPSESKIYSQINYVHNLIDLKLAPITNPLPSWQDLADITNEALQKAQLIDSQRSQSYALGTLGTIYEQTQQIPEAQQLTEQALLIAQLINAPEIAYRWQWQLGRLLQAQGETEKAILAYSEAIRSTESIKNDLVASNQNIQFSFQDSIEPIYRELVSLLLQPNPSGRVSQENLIKARDVIESLQVAELNNFFQEACLTVKSQEVDTFDSKSAVIYPIILKDRLEIIAAFPDQSLHHYVSAVSAQELEKVLAQLRFNLVIRSRRDFFAPAQQVYKWLIEPLEKELELYQIQTLVFVPDTALRNIPVTALYDGEKYLIEKYAIAVTPSLRLLEPQPLKNTNLYTLASGVTEARDNFPPLYYVEEELKNIQKNVPSRILLNQAFTEVKFENNISSETFPIVHIATHGQFSSNVDKTFILTWDEQLNILQLEKLLRGQEIELLVLSACESAAGDRRAALGLAGMAVRSGARSTLATLWSVNDEASAQFMNYFYQALASKTMTKAQAVREAQSKLLTEPKFQHPFYWSAYILIGNWL